ncbi:hypothetical protein D3C83_132410 [compost metagenome]
MPAAAEIERLVGLLADFEDLLVVVLGLDEIMDLQLAETAAEREVLFRRQALFAEKDHVVRQQRRAKLADHAVG